MDVNSTSLLAPRLNLAEATKPRLTELPHHLQLAIADRAEHSAIPLALTSKAMFASTSSVAAKAFMLKRLEESDDAEVVRDVLQQALRMPNSDAESRSELLRGVANRIRWTEEDQQDALLDTFLAAIGALEPPERTDALTALARSGLERGPQGLARATKMLDAINLELLARRAAPLAAMGESLFEGLIPPIEEWVHDEPELWLAPSENDSDDSTASSETSWPPAEQDQELNAEALLHPVPAPEIQQEPEIHEEPEPDLEQEQVPETQPFAIFSLLKQSIEPLGGRVDAAKPLTALAASLHFLDPHDPLHRESFDFIAREVERLPADSRPSLVEEMAKLVRRLEQEPLRGFYQVAAAIKNVKPEHAGPALGILIVNSDDLPAWLKAPTLARISQMVEQMPPEQRATLLGRLTHDLEPLKDIESEHRQSLRAKVLEAIASLPDEFRGIALAERATQTPVMEDQPPIDLRLFDEITSMVAQLPAAHRAVALKAIASRIADLAEPERQPRLDHLLTLTEAVPKHEQGKPLAELIRSIQTLPTSIEAAPEQGEGETLADLIRNSRPLTNEETRSHVWHKAMRMAEKISPEGRAECVAELANQQVISTLSPSLRKNALENLSHLAAALPKQLRKNPFHMIARGIHELPDDARQEAFDKTLGKIGEVPTEHRAFVLSSLAHVAAELPEGPASKGDRHAGPTAAFDAMLQLFEDLSVQDRNYVLNNLAFAQGSALATGRVADLVFEAIGRLPVEKRGSVLILLLDTIKWSSYTSEAMNRHLAAAISMLEELPADHLGEALGTLATRLPVDLLEPEAREQAFPKLLDLAERVPRRDIELPILALARLLHQVPEPKQMQRAFDRLLEMAGQHESHLPMETMSALLSELAMQLHVLPKPLQLKSAWNGIKSLILNRVMHTSEFDRAMAGLVSAAPWLDPTTQAEAVKFLLDSLASFEFPEKSILALADSIPHLTPRFRQKAFDVALEKIRPFNAEVLFQDIKHKTLTVLAGSARSLPGLAPRNAVAGLLEVVPSLVSHNARNDVLVKLARDTLPHALEDSAPVAERLVHPTRSHPSRKVLLTSFSDEVSNLRTTVRKATLQQMISDAHASAGTGFDLRPTLQTLLHATLNEILDRRMRRVPEVA